MVEICHDPFVLKVNSTWAAAKTHCARIGAARRKVWDASEPLALGFVDL